jgi:NAD(P)-dependent dehydrogenase (short-subunit alcohol dehydrogenase family)
MKIDLKREVPNIRRLLRVFRSTIRPGPIASTSAPRRTCFGDLIDWIILTKTVLITGASSGVGAATTTLFAAKGWNVVAASRSIGKFEPGEKMLPLVLDVTDRTAIAEAIQKTRDRFGGLDVLVNNAGIGLAGPLEAVTDQQLRAVFDTNFFGVAAMIQAVVPLMRFQKSGTIINVTSITGRLGLPFMSPYDATKFAVEGLSESLQYELSLFGVKIKVVEPGGVKTAFAHQWARHDAYEPLHQNLINKMTAGAAKARGPEGVASVIFKAAIDRSARFRYAANGSGVFLALHRFLPARLWRGIVRAAFMNRHD